MLQVFTRLTMEHDKRLVLLAATVCFLASAAAINLFLRAKVTTGRDRFVWLGLDAAAAGLGIWATHFIAMLAYDPGVGAGYNLPLTTLSVLAAVLITGAGLTLALRDFDPWTAIVGGAVIGCGIAVTHYTGMLALQLPGWVTWSPNLVIASIALAIIFGGVALVVAAGSDDWRNALLAAVLLTLAIVSMHFSAMGAMSFKPDPDRVIDAVSLSPTSLSLESQVILILCLHISLVLMLFTTGT